MVRGASVKEAVDYVALEEIEVDPEDWAGVRDVTKEAVTRNRDKTEDLLATQETIHAHLTGEQSDTAQENLEV
jgi:hypothetical protein